MTLDGQIVETSESGPCDISLVLCLYKHDGCRTYHGKHEDEAGNENGVHVRVQVTVFVIDDDLGMLLLPTYKGYNTKAPTHNQYFGGVVSNISILFNRYSSFNCTYSNHFCVQDGTTRPSFEVVPQIQSPGKVALEMGL